MILFTATNLVFGMKIASTATALGSRAQGIRSAAKLQEHLDLAAQTSESVLYIVDLESELVEPATPCSLLSQAAQRGAKTIAFAGHVRPDLLDAARAAGCATVMTNGAFSARLPEILQSALQA
ncbi:MAG: hypothetical protein EXS10_09525 [Phycisphaerales bacterium]|nr:hypothetical protein [Phycisphaerales bacterium]